jgi:hypothetical protein
MKRLLTVLGVVVLALARSGVTVAQSDPRVGTWKLDVAKSKFDPGPPYKSDTRTYALAGGGYTVSSDRVLGDGTPLRYEYSAKYDGKDYPITGQGPAGADAIAAKLVDANTTESTLKKAGKAYFTTRSVVSKDGKVLTLTSKGVDSSGKPLNVVAVYNKQ